MGKLSHTDKHSPVVQTGQPNLEQPQPTLDAPNHDTLVKKAVKEEEKEEQKKTGTR